MEFKNLEELKTDSRNKEPEETKRLEKPETNTKIS